MTIDEKVNRVFHIINLNLKTKKTLKLKTIDIHFFSDKEELEVIEKLKKIGFTIDYFYMSKLKMYQYDLLNASDAINPFMFFWTFNKS